MPIQYIVRRSTFSPGALAKAGAAPIIVDSDDNKLKMIPAGSGTTEVEIVDASSTQTLTNKTLTAPTITSPTISGAGTFTGSTLSGNIETDTKVLAASVTYTSSSVLTTVTGFSWTLVAGATYQFEINLPATMTTNGGLSVALKYTTATATSIQLETYQSTDVDNTGAVSSQSTTTTDATRYIDNKTAAYKHNRLYGTLVVGTGGTVAVQTAQNTSNTDTTTILLGSYARFTRAL